MEGVSGGCCLELIYGVAEVKVKKWVFSIGEYIFFTVIRKGNLKALCFIAQE